MKYELPSTELRVIEENKYLKFGEYLNDMPCGNTINKLSLDDLQYVKKLHQENEELKQQIIIMEKYFELIHNISFDYDGYNDVAGLKGVINELNRFANLGRVCNTTEPIFANEGFKFNILLQKLSEQKTGDDK